MQQIFIPFIFLFCLQIGFQGASACTCKVPDPDLMDTLCHADYAAHVKVVSKSGNGYIVKHLEMFKDISEPSIITTSSGSCAIELETGKDYLLSGYASGNSVQVTKCDIGVTWDFIRPKEKAQIRQKNYPNCKAPICVENAASLFSGLCK
ncbi:tissue inhibitor of metalloproteinase domain-containing protein [Ditylenchus destructor]|uniref:Tissue inhibitor of metalloproteinase domain-containing protein n=1 Tax=Ditylenchus destructor TaxID=166010 RepID=A0AAD4MUN0_9BILA|nr:tissue inhibitor of metalloproteinase domain-containing protein [Ditylenchus destructor]